MEIKYVKNVIRLAKAAMGVLIYATLACFHKIEKSIMKVVYVKQVITILEL